MPNISSRPTNFPLRINNYVPAMRYASDVNYNGSTRLDFGAPIAASINNVLNALSIAVAGQVDISGIVSFLPYGRTLQVQASGAATSNVTVYGYDYLGQPMAESFTLNGVTPVQGKKAFFAGNYVTFGATAGTTISIGGHQSFGLPYKAIRALWETNNGALVAAGTLVAPSLADPQTLTSADPRGIYTPTTVPNGSNAITATFDFLNDVNPANNGGLHGIRHVVA